MPNDKSSEIHTSEPIVKRVQLKVVIVKNYYALKLNQNFIFDNHVKKLTENCEHPLN